MKVRLELAVAQALRVALAQVLARSHQEAGGAAGRASQMASMRVRRSPFNKRIFPSHPSPRRAASLQRCIDFVASL
jgi:hypothetical protein